MTPFRLDENEQTFLVRWVVANGVGWGVGLILAAAILTLAALMRAWLPVVVLLPAFPLAGGVAGWAVGFAQWQALSEPDAPPDPTWQRASAVGGAVGIVPAVLLAALLRFDPLVAQFALGAGVAAGVGGGQIMLGSSPNWRAAYRWALVNGAAGVVCAGISPSGRALWLPLTCLIGTGFFGVITGAALVRIRRLT